MIEKKFLLCRQGFHYQSTAKLHWLPQKTLARHKTFSDNAAKRHTKFALTDLNTPRHRLNRADFPFTSLKKNLAYPHCLPRAGLFFYVLYAKRIHLYIDARGDGPRDPHKVSTSPPPPTESNSFHPPLSLKRERMKKTRER